MSTLMILIEKVFLLVLFCCCFPVDFEICFKDTPLPIHKIMFRLHTNLIVCFILSHFIYQQKADFGTCLSTLTILLLLFGVVATGIYLIIEKVGDSHPDTPPSDSTYEYGDPLNSSPTEVWISIGFLVSGLTGIGLFFPFVIFFCFLKIRWRFRRGGRRTSVVTPHTINV